MKKFTSIDEYHAAFDESHRVMMQQLRMAIRSAAPKAVEQISYNMPSFKQGKVVCYYAAHRNHIGFYPTSGPIKELGAELSKYVFSKGAVQFPIGKKVPVMLVKKLVRSRLRIIEG